MIRSGLRSRFKLTRVRLRPTNSSSTPGSTPAPNRLKENKIYYFRFRSFFISVYSQLQIPIPALTKSSFMEDRRYETTNFNDLNSLSTDSCETHLRNKQSESISRYSSQTPATPTPGFDSDSAAQSSIDVSLR